MLFPLATDDVHPYDQDGLATPYVSIAITLWYANFILFIDCIVVQGDLPVVDTSRGCYLAPPKQF